MEIPDAPIIALADERLLTKAADNLIDNALKHNPRGTVVRVVCSRTRRSARLSVSNTGNSIPEDIRETIFEPFVTGDGARNPEHGSGLGLAIARRYVELQGGAIRLVDKPAPPFKVEICIELPLATGHA